MRNDLPTPLWPTRIQLERRRTKSPPARASICARLMVGLKAQSNWSRVQTSGKRATAMRRAMARSRRWLARSPSKRWANSRCDQPALSAWASSASSAGAAGLIFRICRWSRRSWRWSGVVVGRRRFGMVGVLGEEGAVVGGRPGRHRVVAQQGSQMVLLLFGQFFQGRLRPGAGQEDAFHRRRAEGAIADGALQGGVHVGDSIAGQHGQSLVRLAAAVALAADEPLEEAQGGRPQCGKALLQLG